MVARKSRRRITTAAFCFALGIVVYAHPAYCEEAGLTFFGWSDQHVRTDGDGDHLVPAIEAMNGLAGRRYPDEVGGVVAEPAFVLGCTTTLNRPR